MREIERKTASQLRSLIEEASALLRKMENYPEEPEQDLVVIEVRFSPSLKIYRYAGIRIIDRWYLTGGTNGGSVRNVEWFKIFEFFERKHAEIVKVEAAVRVSDVADFA